MCYFSLYLLLYESIFNTSSVTYLEAIVSFFFRWGHVHYWKLECKVGSIEIKTQLNKPNQACRPIGQKKINVVSYCILYDGVIK